MIVRSAKSPIVPVVFRPVSTFKRTLPVLDLSVENIALIQKYGAGIKKVILGGRNLLEIIGGVVFSGGTATLLIDFCVGLDKLQTAGISAMAAGFASTVLGWLKSVGKKINDFSKSLDNTPKDEFIKSCVNGTKKKLSFLLKPNEKNYNFWIQNEIEKTIFNAVYLLPRTNPEGEDITIYYPGFGHDIQSVLAGTDATLIVASDLWRDFDNKGQVDNIYAVIEILKEMGAEINNELSLIPEDKSEGKAIINFKYKSVKGELKERILVYYYGQNAKNLVPEELEPGFDVLWVDSAPVFSNKSNSNMEVAELLYGNGYLVISRAQETEILTRDNLIERVSNE